MTSRDRTKFVKAAGAALATAALATAALTGTASVAVAQNQTVVGNDNYAPEVVNYQKGLLTEDELTEKLRYAGKVTSGKKISNEFFASSTYSGVNRFGSETTVKVEYGQYPEGAATFSDATSFMFAWDELKPAGKQSQWRKVASKTTSEGQHIYAVALPAGVGTYVLTEVTGTAATQLGEKTLRNLASMTAQAQLQKIIP
jgi:hypothetical protein